MAQQFVQAKPSTLSGSGVSATDTTVTLNEFVFRNSGDPVTTADIGTTAYGTLEPGNNDREEIISFTGVTQIGDGTATLTGVTRGLDPASPYTAVTALRKSHAGGTTFVMSNNPQVYNDLTSFNEDETITGTWTFTTPNFPRMNDNTAPTDDEQLATKKYVDDTALAGAPDATETVKGVVEIATDAELAAGAAPGSGNTTADLVAHAQSFNVTAAGGKVPVADGSGTLGVDWLGMNNQGEIIYNDGSDIPAGLTIGTAGQILQVDSGGTDPEWVTRETLPENPELGDMAVYNGSAWQNATYEQSLIEVRKVNIVNNLVDWDVDNSGTGNFNVFAGAGARMDVEATTAGSAQSVVYKNNINLQMSDATWEISVRVKFVETAAALNRQLHFGIVRAFTDLNSSPSGWGGVAEGATFYYSDGTLTTTTRTANVGTTQNTVAGVTISDFNDFRIVYDGIDIKFYVNDVLEETHTTNLPTNGTQAANAIGVGVRDVNSTNAQVIGDVTAFMYAQGGHS